jgi:hypothetical protein
MKPRIVTHAALVIIFCLFGCSSPGQRQPASESAPINSANLIASDLSDRVQILNSSVYAYNYLSGVPLRRTSAIWPALRRRASRYLDTSQGKLNLDIPGLYLALDPTSTREFGGKGPNWLLNRVELPAGLRYLDISKTGYDPLPTEIVKALAADGCVPTDEYKSHFNYSDLLKQNLGPTCRKIGQAALKSLNVQALGYSYSVNSATRRFFVDCCV